MSIYLDRAIELRKDIDKHHNCAESVVLSFVPEANIDRETAIRVTANFAQGMKMGSTCGVIVGSLMVLGLFGIDDQATINSFILDFKRSHDGLTTCGELLRKSHSQGIERKTQCDKLVFEGVERLEKILKEKNLIH